MNNITLPVDLFVNTFLQGDWYGYKPIPKSVGDALKQALPNHEEYFHLDSNPGAQYYDLWSKDGWLNELKRREYLVCVTQASAGDKMSVASMPKKPTKEELTKQLIAAGIKGDINEVNRIQQILMTL